MTRQKMSWGHIDWLYTHSEGSPERSMNIGLCTILPGQSQHEHIHYGAEQFIYTLAGQNLHIVNGQEYVMTPGRHLYMVSGVTHNTVNRHDQPSIELLISNPVSYYEPAHQTVPENSRPGPGNMYAAIEAIGSSLMESFHAPFTIFDEQRRVVFQNDYFSPYCHAHCTPTSSPTTCSCLGRQKRMKHEKDHIWFICPHGHVIYHLPVIFRTREIGAIRGGHIVVTEISGPLGPPEVYDTPQSTAIGIQKLLKQVIKSIQAYCEFDSTRVELSLKNKTLWETESRKLSLEKSLRLSEENVTNLRINRHFLFNTLNSMADLALQKEGETLYAAIIQLSRMFRYVMPTERVSVTVREELEYVDNYLKLQKLRYGSNLLVARAVETDLLEVRVPVNFLQPIIENAFTHGFKDTVGLMRVFVEVGQRDGRLFIAVKNNGKQMDDASLLRVRSGLISNSGHGLSLIYTKLKSAYAHDFEMDIASEWDASQGFMTAVTITVPKSFQGGS